MTRSPYIIIGIFVGLLLIAAAVSARLFDIIIYFLLAGIIPGTNYSLSPLAMFIIMVAASWLVALYAWTAIRDVYRSYQDAKKVLKRAQRMPRRRYQRG